MRHEIYTLSAVEILRKVANYELDLGLSYLDDERLAEYETLPIFRERYLFVTGDAALLAGVRAMSWADAATQQHPLARAPSRSPASAIS